MIYLLIPQPAKYEIAHSSIILLLVLITGW